MADLDPFISVQDLQDYLGRTVVGTSGGTIAVDAACEICRDIGGVSFNHGTSTVTLDGTGTDALLLPEVPVIAAGTVTVGGTAGTAVTDFVLKDNGVLIRKIPDPALVDWYSYAQLPTIVWPAGRQNIRVTYEHGWTADDFPRSVKMVALSVAARLAVQGPAVEETLGDNRIKYAVANTDLTAGEKAILRKAAGR